MEKLWDFLDLLHAERQLRADDFILGKDKTIVWVVAGSGGKGFEFLVYDRTTGDFIEKKQKLSQVVSVPFDLIKPSKELLKKLKSQEARRKR
ncbi:MAG: hypothetical protein PHT40_02875 [Patescibacteria group bacterium]|nr:hypothetical protein [Patescibacteria group bacterium]